MCILSASSCAGTACIWQMTETTSRAMARSWRGIRHTDIRLLFRRHGRLNYCLPFSVGRHRNQCVRFKFERLQTGKRNELLLANVHANATKFNIREALYMPEAFPRIQRNNTIIVRRNDMELIGKILEARLKVNSRGHFQSTFQSRRSLFTYQPDS